jgi:hypothetical protein
LSFCVRCKIKSPAQHHSLFGFAKSPIFKFNVMLGISTARRQAKSQKGIKKEKKQKSQFHVALQLHLLQSASSSHVMCRMPMFHPDFI